MQRFLVLITSFMIFALNIFSQESMKDQLFNKVDQVLEKANKEKANVYSPQNYSQAMEYYNSALNSLKKGGNIQEIRDNINNAQNHLVKALDFTDIAKLTFVTAIESRQAAQDAGANLYATELWKKAEEQFKDAMEEMEDDDLEDAKETAGEAETAYREAELVAIKVDLLGPARDMLKKSEEMDAEDYAPVSLQKARRSLANVEELMNKNRYAEEEGLTQAKEAKYHAQHTIFLTKKIKNLETKDNALEETLLNLENNLDNIAQELDVELDFSEGYDKPLETIIAEIQTLQESNIEYLRELNSLRDQNSMMEERLAKYTDTEKELQQTIALKKSQEKKVKSINKSFSKNEGQVFVDGDNVVIRLYGLTFPTGKSEIKPKYFGLLRKVQDGIREFDNCEVIIEGHTDSRGGAKLNQRLSEERANAVKTYIVSNMNFPPSKIKSVGFGETKPVANNETKVGRAKNRRIDVVIIPEWAQK